MKNILIAACIVLGMSACNKDKSEDPSPRNCRTVDETYNTGDDDGIYIIEYTNGTSEISSTYYAPGEQICD